MISRTFPNMRAEIASLLQWQITHINSYAINQCVMFKSKTYSLSQHLTVMASRDKLILHLLAFGDKDEQWFLWKYLGVCLGCSPLVPDVLYLSGDPLNDKATHQIWALSWLMTQNSRSEFKLHLSYWQTHASSFKV